MICYNTPFHIIQLRYTQTLRHSDANTPTRWLEMLCPIHSNHCLKSAPSETAHRLNEGGDKTGTSHQSQGLIPLIAGSCCAQSQYTRTPASSRPARSVRWCTVCHCYTKRRCCAPPFHPYPPSRHLQDSCSLPCPRRFQAPPINLALSAQVNLACVASVSLLHTQP
eukprot:COSAG01_NODE_13775_length_1537_cov_2.120306_1_plen_166_part_00